MTHPTLRATVAALALAAGLAHAGATEDQIKQKMETFIGAPVVESVTATVDTLRAGGTIDLLLQDSVQEYGASASAGVPAKRVGVGLHT